MSLNVGFVPAQDIPFNDYCNNLMWARTVAARYFETAARRAAPTGEVINSVEKAHVYLDAHMYILESFELADSRYGLALRAAVSLLVARIPSDLRRLEWSKWTVRPSEESRNDYRLDESLLLPGEDGYEANSDHCVFEGDVRPYRVVKLPPPRRPTVTPSPKKPMTGVPEPPLPAPKRPPPPAAPSPEPPKELAFSAPGRKLVGVMLPPAGSALGGPNTRKRQREQAAITEAPVPISSVRDEPIVEASSSKKLPKTPVPASVPQASTSKPKSTAGPVGLKKRARKVLRKSPAPSVPKPRPTAKKPNFVPSSDSEVPESSGEDEDRPASKEPWFLPSDEPISAGITPPPAKRVRLASPVHEEPLAPPPRAYHPLTGEPLSHFRFVNLSAPSEPAPPLPSAGLSSKVKGKKREVAPPSPTPAVESLVKPKGKKRLAAVLPSLLPSARPSGSNSGAARPIDNTFYARAFHPGLDLQFHEPPSREALERLKLSALPKAPSSLTKPPKQIRTGREYIYRAHSDKNPYYIRPPLLSWPCFNCTLAGTADECTFSSKVGEERCNMCKTGRHGPCSSRWTADQLYRAATLLDPLTLSGDGAIARGLARVESINTQLDLLGKVVNQLRADREEVVSQLADGLDAIASREHGTEIIDAYASISDFLKSFIVRPGSSGEGFDDAGESGDAEDMDDSSGDDA
ncbi:hypothetical protein EDD18DRAFT_1349523 [Armillaria luteobubalina]|uniref:Uncharacterized protein n=1 Tax=Armillaria luteobubalina TaxID=153913 RepID=A0AA39QC22_9AGAR|nr:hypothetical protein EDD18DRAFT_1349523 [Armillaria luteobubalina]